MKARSKTTQQAARQINFSDKGEPMKSNRKTKQSAITALSIHPAAATFPDLTADEFAALKNDIRKHGQQTPILTKAGQIIDGRQRYRACMELGIEPSCIEITSGITAEAVMISQNLLHRHLNDSQRAMIGCRLVNTQVGSNQSTGESMTQEAVAKLLGVSADSIQRALKVIKAGHAALVKTVERGLLTVNEAMKLSKLPEKVVKNVLVAANDSNFRVKAKAACTREAEVKREKLATHIEAISASNQPLSTVDGKFGVLYIDPPWDYLSVSDTKYPTMNRDELLALDVASKAADDAVCFLWVPASQLPLAIELMVAWGFEYKTCAVWDKEHPGTGMYFQSRHELLLLGTKGTLPAVEPKNRQQSILTEKRTEHSRKPQAAYAMIEQMYPGLSKLELFARGKARQGWDVWGNQAIPAEKPKTVKVAAGKPPKRQVAANQPTFKKAA